jgi:PBSX family phage terminase large subunit
MKLNASKVFYDIDKAMKDGYRIILEEGSSRSSKTWSNFQIIFLYALQNRRKRIIVLRDTAVSCRDIVESEFKDWLNDPLGRNKEYERGEIELDELDYYLKSESLLTYIKINLTKHSYTFPNGSTIIFTGADNMTQVIGKANDIVWVNEPYTFSEEVMKQLLKRVVKCLIIDWNPSQNHYIENYKAREDCILLHSTFKDNPFLSDEVRKELLAAKPLMNKYFDIEVEILRHEPIENVKEYIKEQEKEVQEEILMCWKNEQERTANDYDWQVYGLGIKAERPEKIYKGWSNIDDDFYESLSEVEFFGLDFGLSSPSGLVGIKVRENNLYIKEYWYSPSSSWWVGNEERNQTYVERLNLFKIPKENYLICDSAEPTTIEKINIGGYYNAIPIAKPKGSVKAGIRLLQQAKVFVTQSSRNVWNEYENYSWMKSMKGEVLDSPLMKNDHSLDAIRYAMMYYAALHS